MNRHHDHTQVARVQVGQVWQDCDYRMRGRKGRVVAFLTDNGVPKVVLHMDSGRTTKIALRRMKPTSTGWRLVDETP